MDGCKHTFLILAAGMVVVALTAPWAHAQTADRWAEARNRLVDEQIVRAGVTNQRVIKVMRTVPRHEFVPGRQRRNAYYDMALPIGHQQTISPPFIVANMTAHLDPQPTDSVLEIGTGSGYQAAVLSGLVQDVYTIEIVEPLGRRAARTLKRLDYDNIHTKIGDGFQGWPEHAPFDSIIVTCSPENVPQALVDQLKEGGRMVIPLGERFQQMLYLFTKVDGKLKSEAMEPTFFVPMTGRAEELREVKPDNSSPAIVNGGFEDSTEFEGRPDGWYYIRQATVDGDRTVPEGRKCLTFTNREAGRGAQALQAFGIDGREVRELEISLWVRARDARVGRSKEERPKMLVTFFDSTRASIGQREIGPWTGTFDWKQHKEKIRLPIKARGAVVGIGLLGGTGEISFDAVEVRAAEP